MSSHELWLAGAPYELRSGTLLKSAMVTSGAITNRVDRMERKDLVERVRSYAASRWRNLVRFAAATRWATTS